MGQAPLLVFGVSGQVATELRLEEDVLALSRSEADLSNPEAGAAAIAEIAPRAVINAAAYTAVDRAETEEDLATRINGDAPGAMAHACAARAIPFVHLSTDYVFDGSGDTPWHPEFATGPCNAYGRSKLAGERAVRAAGGCHAILRTSWVVSAHGSNFVKTMLRLGTERERLSIVGDQIGGPTLAPEIAAACLSIARQLAADPAKSGTYHFAGTPDVSWAGFAREIFRQSGLDCAVDGIPTSAYPTPATRPANSRLDCATTEAVFGLSQPDWRVGLTDILAALGHGRS